MTNPQTPDNQPQPPENQHQGERSNTTVIIFLRRAGIALGIVLLASGIGSTVWLWHFVTNDLAALVEKEISKTIKRPVFLGAVKSFSLSGISFGASSLPPTPTDSDRARADSVKVKFDIIQLLATHTLSLQITFVNADAYIAQDEKGRWLSIPKIERAQGWLKVSLDSLAVENARVFLSPYEATASSKKPIQLQAVNGILRFRDKYKRIIYEVSGQNVLGYFKIQGSSSLPNLATTDISVQAENFSALALYRLLKHTAKLPLALYDGLLDGNLQIQFRPQKLPEFKGKANLKAVTAKINLLPKILTKTNGLLIFQPRQKLVLKNVTTIYDKVPALANGIAALKENSNLNILVQRVNAKEALETLDIKFPVPVTGDVQASLKANGPITQPVISGTISSLDKNKGAPLQVERFKLENFGAGIVFTRGNLKLDYLRAIPTIGGIVTAVGNVKLNSLNNLPLVNLEFRASQIPGETLAKLYNFSPKFKLGSLAATGYIVGTTNNLQTTLSWQAPEAIYPASGMAIVKGFLETAVFRDTIVKIAAGTVVASGTLKDGIFSLNLEPKNLSLNQLVAIVNQEFLKDSKNKLPLLKQPSQIVTGNIRISGDINSLDADTIAVNGLALASIAGGIVSITGALKNGRWNISVDPSNIKLANLPEYLDTSLFLSPTEISRLPISITNAYITLSGTTNNLTAAAINANANARLIVANGSATITARLQDGSWQATVAGENINVSKITSQITPGFLPSLPVNLVAGEITFAGDVSFNSLQAGDGQLTLAVADGSLKVEDIRLQNNIWQAVANVSQLNLKPFLPNVAAKLGRFSGSFIVAGDIKRLTGKRQRQKSAENIFVVDFLESIYVKGAGVLGVAGGVANLSEIKIEQGRWQTALTAERVAVIPLVENNFKSILKNLPLSEIGTFTGNITAQGDFKSLFSAFQNKQPLDASIGVNLAGNLGVAGGAANINASLTRSNFLAQVALSNISVSRFLPEQSELTQEASLNGNFIVSGKTEFNLNALAITGAATLDVAGGKINISKLQVQNRRLQGAIALRDIQLARLSNQLRGQFSGNLNLWGNLDTLTLANIRAQGDVLLSQGVSIVKKPLNAAIAWDGEKLQINQAKAPGLNVSGFVTVDTQNIALTGINLNVQARSYNLRDLFWENLSNVIAPIGEADFTGKIQGTLQNPRITGNIQLRNFHLNKIAFASVLTGQATLAIGEKIQVQLQGEQDEIQINATFSSSLEPSSLSFLLRRGESLISGSGNAQNLSVALKQFPLAVLNLTTPTIAGPGPISGLLSGEFNLAYGKILQCRDILCALNAIQADGKITLENPRVGVINAHKLAGQITLANGIVELQEGRLFKGQSQYIVTGSLACPWAFLPTVFTNNNREVCTNPQYQAKIAIEHGELQDILTSLQIFRLQDITRGFSAPKYVSGAEVAPVSINVQGLDILTQLHRFSEIVALLEQQQQVRQKASPLPELQDLQGTFNGKISLMGSLKGVVNSQFEISGKDWKWGEYAVERLLIAGNFENNIITLLPFEIQTGNSLISFSGSLGLLNQSGQLRVRNFPVETLFKIVSKFTDVSIPIQLTGDVNVDATLAGNLFNPQAKGEITLVKGILNQTPVQMAQTSFSYSESRLNIGSIIKVGGLEPIQVVGNIPYQIFPFSQPPESEQINLAINVQNEGLALLNILSGNRVRWINGKGQVQVRVEGNFKEPLVTGIAQIEEATIGAQLLPEPLTNVTGKVLFNRDRILVEGINGQFSKGLILAQGVLPIFAEFSPNDPDAANPLRISLEQLVMNLKGLYRGGVNGIITLNGTALQPQIGGIVELRNGQVFLSEKTVTGAGAGALTADAAIQPLLNDLRLILSKDVEIVFPPILNFIAGGELTINGFLDDLKPQGTIRLRRGQVNLFTTQFRLLRGYEQTAIFTPENGLDPILDVRLGASVSEVKNSRLPASAFANEIQDLPAMGFGETQTIRIQARIQGAASQLFDNLELTSSPSRTQSEIVALLGGGFVNTLGRGDSALALANFAGSAFLSPIESAFTNALGVTEFRLFPTTVTRDGERSFNLAAEVGVDITRKFSASVLRILTDSTQPTQFNLRYRINNRTLLRGATDLSGESRATVEYEIRF